MKPICVGCRRFYRPEKNGFAFIEGMPVGNVRPLPGTAEPDNWKPYKLWEGDLWRCHGCGHLLIVGVGLAPIAEHYQPDFNSKAAAHGVELQVNDC